MVIVNHFSKLLHVIALPILPSAFETPEIMFNHIFRYFSIPEDIVSIWGDEFTSQVWGGFMEKLGVLVSMTSGYDVERANQEIGRFFCTFCADHQEEWAQFLKWGEYAQNSFRHTSTNCTPFWDVLEYKLPSFGMPTPQTHRW